MHLPIRTSWDGTPVSKAHHVDVHVVHQDDGIRLTVHAPHYADPLPDAPVGPVFGLWEYEVVELFLAGPGDPRPYLEVELGPGGHHLVLRLRGTRRIVARKLPLEPQVHVTEGRWTAVVDIPDTYLPPSPWTVNATAVHGVGEQRTWLSAAPLPGTTPDFHQLDAFVPFDTDGPGSPTEPLPAS